MPNPTFQPPILTDEFDPETMKPSLTVEGDVVLKEWSMLAPDQQGGQTLKVARALHDLDDLEGVEVGGGDSLVPTIHLSDESCRGQGERLLSPGRIPFYGCILF
jgi:hypothetical protein